MNLNELGEKSPAAIILGKFVNKHNQTLIGLYRTSRPKVFCKKGPRSATLLKRRLWHRCFPVNFAKFLRTSFFTEHLWWLLLKRDTIINFNNLRKHRNENYKKHVWQKNIC